MCFVYDAEIDVSSFLVFSFDTDFEYVRIGSVIDNKALVFVRVSVVGINLYTRVVYDIVD